MIDNLTTYKAWAPDDALWTQWVKPVLFACGPGHDNTELIIPEINWVAQADNKTMVIIDLPGKDGVEEGLALARLGYRPVPLYNGVNGPSDASMIVKVDDIITALFKGAGELAKFTMVSDAPPAFMLDSNRMKGPEKPLGKYDNRWCVFPQDMPSSSFLLHRGIDRVIVRSNSIQADLSHVLYRYQKQGIKIYLYHEYLKEMTVSEPSRFKSLFYRFNVTLGLTRNAAGGFGAMIPEPMQSDSDTRYYGIG